jgi:hypothetical protein
MSFIEFVAALTCSVAFPARARRRPSRTCRRCGVDRCRRFLFREFRIGANAGAAAGEVGGDGDGAGRAEARYGDVADTMAQTAARHPREQESDELGIHAAWGTSVCNSSSPGPQSDDSCEGRVKVCFFPETGRFSKKNREAIEHERAITERD